MSFALAEAFFHASLQFGEFGVKPCIANLLCLRLFRWGFLSRAGLWDKSHLMRQIEKYNIYIFFKSDI